ncbi:hypothetical protein FJR11_00115 [Anabaena sp. UHCC 0187]|uniref:hypothetical protein n=1 Tax=Anabaena sp. UHCC 0187 TaxID=2590018 RepID=UPI0014473927|nr:hypothetical protein [Anabaena sp. UHCC 0187]MTJ11027.1 hypothetical protein [Anabaena sp. UHCC 0187]
MRTVINPNTGQFRGTKSSGRSRPEHYKDKAFLEAKKRSLEVFAWKYNTFIYLCSSSNISEFEDRVEEIRDQLMEGRYPLSTEDVKMLKQLLNKLDIFRLMAIARLTEPLLEIEAYAKDAADIIRILLQHHKAEVRYSGLEAISFGLGEVEIAEEILAEAKNLLKNEENTSVREYLESL